MKMLTKEWLISTFGIRYHTLRTRQDR